MLIPLILVGVSSYLIYLLLRPSPSFWEKYGITSYPSWGLLDNLGIFLGRLSPGDVDRIIYSKMSSSKLGGFTQMGQHSVLIKDLDIAKLILIKDFNYFVDRRILHTGHKVFDKNLSSLEGDEWKGVRTSMSPVFTTGKIRRMMSHFNSVGHEWVKYLQAEMNESGFIEVDVTEQATRYTVDAIAAAGFGLNAGTIRNKGSHFAKMGLAIGKFDTKQIAKIALGMYFPKILRLLGLTVLDPEAMDFFANLVGEGLAIREKGDQKAGKTTDFIQLIVEMRKGQLKHEEELTAFEKEAEINVNEKKNYLQDDNFAKAQGVMLFVAGFMATANFIGVAMYVLATEKKVQDKLREEVKRLFNDGKDDLDYDELNGLVYLDMVVCEMLRKYPPAGRLERKCAKDYQIEGVTIPKGSMAVVSVVSVHHDKKYYENPDEFYPEHFTPEVKAKRNPYAYMPFGHGPRNCLGMRFALVECKAAVALMVKNFIIEPGRNTSIPIKMKCTPFGVQIPDGLELRLRQVK